MKVDRISYSKLLPTGVYANERIGLEAELNSGDDAEISMDILRNMVAQLHKKYNPQYYQPNDEYNVPGEPLSVPIEKKDPKEMQIQLHIESINTYTDPERLKKNYAPLVEKTPELKEAYNNKLKSFQ